MEFFINWQNVISVVKICCAWFLNDVIKYLISTEHNTTELKNNYVLISNLGIYFWFNDFSNKDRKLILKRC